MNWYDPRWAGGHWGPPPPPPDPNRGLHLTRRDRFVAARQADWSELSRLLDNWGSKGSDGDSISRAAALYRALCHDLARCSAAHHGADLAAHLDALAARAHSRLYGRRAARVPNAFKFVAVEFPRAVRANWRFFTLSTALFFLPFAIGLTGSLTSNQFARDVLPPEMLEMLARAYKKGFDGGRSEGADSQMAGFYVYNNVGIAFRCFATGIFAGLGSMFFLVYSGLMIGCIAGYVTSAGAGGNIWTFMAGHAPFEITAILIAGGAGLQMGFSLVSTNGLTRLASLWSQRWSLAAQIVGAALMLCIAAAIEAFWSPSSVPPLGKWIFATVAALSVTAFLLFAGRRRRTA